MVLPPKPSQLPYYPINIVILEVLTSPPRQSPSLTRAQFCGRVAEWLARGILTAETGV